MRSNFADGSTQIEHSGGVQKHMAFNADPTLAVKGGGLPDKVTLEFIGSEINHFIYGESGTKGIGLVIRAKDTATGEELDSPLFYSAGRTDAWAPTADNKGLDPLKGQEFLTENSRLCMFLDKLRTAENGVKFTGNDFGILKGMVGYCMRVPGPETNMAPRKRPDGSVADNSILVVTRVIVGPGGRAIAQAARSASTTRVASAQAPAPAQAQTSTAAPESVVAGVEAGSLPEQLRDWISGKLTEAQAEGKPGVTRAVLVQSLQAEFCKPKGIKLTEAAKLLATPTRLAELGLIVGTGETVTGVSAAA